MRFVYLKLIHVSLFCLSLGKEKWIRSSLHWILKFNLSFVRRSIWKKRRKWDWQKDKNQLSSSPMGNFEETFLDVSYFCRLSNRSLTFFNLCQKWFNTIFFTIFFPYTLVNINIFFHFRIMLSNKGSTAVYSICW